jgi:hypothetical protein
MKGRRKRLALKKTTVRRLTAQQLAAAAGASGPDREHEQRSGVEEPLEDPPNSGR